MDEHIVNVNINNFAEEDKGGGLRRLSTKSGLFAYFFNPSLSGVLYRIFVHYSNYEFLVFCLKLPYCNLSIVILHCTRTYYLVFILFINNEFIRSNALRVNDIFWFFICHNALCFFPIPFLKTNYPWYRTISEFKLWQNTYFTRKQTIKETITEDKLPQRQTITEDPTFQRIHYHRRQTVSEETLP